MRHEHGPCAAHAEPSYIESGRPRKAVDDGFCGFCRREPAEDVRRVEYSRNGFQAEQLMICAECRPVLAAHLEGRVPGEAV